MSDTELVAHHVAAHPFAAGLETADVDLLQSLGTLVEFDSADVIFNQGDAADTFYLVRTGVVALGLPSAGNSIQVIQSLSEGTAVGWSWMFPPYRWQFTALASTKVRSIAFPAADLRAAFAADHATGYRFMARMAETMADRLKAARMQIVNLTTR